MSKMAYSCDRISSVSKPEKVGVQIRDVFSFNYDIFGWFVNKLVGTEKLDNKVDIIEGILKQKNYVSQAYMGGTLYTNGFVYVLVKSESVTVGTDIDRNKYNNVGHKINGHKLTQFLVVLKYYERIQ
tara:strand:+ start:3091 stop:3471 length:381 start_codon:yes stop_codon:yes gene_type:complete